MRDFNIVMKGDLCYVVDKKTDTQLLLPKSFGDNIVPMAAECKDVKIMIIHNSEIIIYSGNKRVRYLLEGKTVGDAPNVYRLTRSVYEQLQLNLEEFGIPTAMTERSCNISVLDDGALRFENAEFTDRVDLLLSNQLKDYNKLRGIISLSAVTVHGNHQAYIEFLRGKSPMIKLCLTCGTYLFISNQHDVTYVEGVDTYVFVSDEFIRRISLCVEPCVNCKGGVPREY